jgi:hypothetical protein
MIHHTASGSTNLEPRLLLLGEHRFLDHLGLDGDVGQALKAEPDVAAELPSRLDTANGKSGLDAHAPLAGIIWCRW